MNPEYPDVPKHIFDAFLRGDRKSFEFIYDKYHNLFFCFAMRRTVDYEIAIEAEELAWVLLWKKVPTFKKDMTIHQVRAWMYKVIYNNVIRYLDRNKRRLIVETTYFENTERESYTSSVIKSETFFHLIKEFGNLPRKCEETFFLHYEMGYDSGQISEILKVSKSTVKTQLARGLQLLRQNEKIVEYYQAYK